MLKLILEGTNCDNRKRIVFGLFDDACGTANGSLMFKHLKTNRVPASRDDALDMIKKYRTYIKDMLQDFHLIDLKTYMVLRDFASRAQSLIKNIEYDLNRFSFANYLDSEKLHRFVDMLYNFIDKKIIFVLQIRMLKGKGSFS